MQESIEKCRGIMWKWGNLKFKETFPGRPSLERDFCPASQLSFLYSNSLYLTAFLAFSAPYLKPMSLALASPQDSLMALCKKNYPNPPSLSFFYSFSFFEKTPRKSSCPPYRMSHAALSPLEIVPQVAYKVVPTTLQKSTSYRC